MGLQSFYEGVRRVAVHAAGLGGNRLELFSIELQEEVERQTSHLVWLLAAFIFGGLGLLLASVLLLIIFWNDYRITVAASLLLLYVGLCLFCVLTLWRRIRQAPTPFAVTIEEFRRDSAALLRKTEEGR